MSPDTPAGPEITRADVARYHDELSNWGRWGDDDQLGALNHITADHTRAAAASVTTGVTVSLSRPLPTKVGPENPDPVVHEMLRAAVDGGSADSITVAPHGYATTHIDALCHINGERLYNGYPIDTVTAQGATELGIHSLADGVVTRGVLLDVARHRGLDWLEPGDPVGPDELAEVAAGAGVEIGAGDLLVVRTGRWARSEAEGPWAPSDGLAGLHASCLPWLHERRVAALGSDGVSDVIPSGVDGVRLPIHHVAIVAIGLHLFDNLELEPLATACADHDRWTFLITVAPLVLLGGTGSPVNPIAVF